MPKSPSTLCKLLTSVALIFAMVSSGFAHTGLRPALSPDITAYVAAGGSLSDICGSIGEQDGTYSQKCEACRLMDTALAPRFCHALPMVLSDQTRVLAFVAKRLYHSRPLDPTRLTRAPPQA